MEIEYKNDKYTLDPEKAIESGALKLIKNFTIKDVREGDLFKYESVTAVAVKIDGRKIKFTTCNKGTSYESYFEEFNTLDISIMRDGVWKDGD